MKDLRDELNNKRLKVKDPIEQILDEKNTENIVLFDEDNNSIELEQIALINNNEKLYAILIPVTPMQGVEEGEGIVVYIDEDKHDISVVNNTKTIDEVLEIYQKLLEETGEEE